MMEMPKYCALFFLLLLRICAASSLAPAVLPLIVRNPYLSAWLPNAREEPWSSWPIFWYGQDVRLPFVSRVSAPALMPFIS